METTQVESSNVDEVSYEAATKTMFVRFKKSGTYAYYDVPRTIYTGLVNASSVGSYFHQNVKNAFRYAKV